MKPYRIITSPNVQLQKTCVPITPKQFGSSTLRNQALRMITTMIRSSGIGLAANQVGLNIRLIIVNIAGFKNEIMCNPQITSFHNTAFETHTEGCLSFPGRKQDMRRSQHLTVQYFNLDGTEVIREFTGLTARCIQHEIDHINGITFLDKQWII